MSNPVSFNEHISIRLQRSSDASFNGASPWFFETSCGTPAQTGLRFMFDTGTTHTWVTSSKCMTDACSLHRRFNQDLSSSFFYKSTPQTIDFGPWGEMKVRLCNDRIYATESPIIVDFFEAENYAGSQFETLAWDGAIAVPSIQCSQGDSTDFLSALKNNKLIDSHIISFIHNSQHGTGICVLGTPSQQPEQWIPLLRFDNDPECWTIPLDVVRGSDSGVILEDIPFALDSGSSFFKGDGYFIWKIIRCITASGRYPTVIHSPDSPDNYPFQDIIFTIAGIEYRLTKHQYFMQTAPGEYRLAFSPMQGLEGLLLVGSVFLETVFSVFDFDNQRIGLTSLMENIK